ncbi:hypothetical protein B296_00049439 [Ensete ventricosum]|uniref:Uncharacterized protein n=1 Tax=Ensete ventricosum TaxID=4639 RepID=A0A426WWE2_ENSVE|nr:hypothetical protein B296_00049439 [Ensete ventricosum]
MVSEPSESRRCLQARGGHLQAVCMQRWLAMAKAPCTGGGRLRAARRGKSRLEARPLAVWRRPPLSRATADGQGQSSPVQGWRRRKGGKMG